jgi:tetratricopeptide (TPR) repeat protein
MLPGAVVALVSGRAGDGGPPPMGPCGTTQLAVWCAESLWWSREVDLLAWVNAASRDSLLTGYVQAAAAVGIDPGGSAEQMAARFTGWLREAARPWLVVLDDLRDPGDLDGLWPAGPAGWAVITAPDENVVAGRAAGVRVLPVGAFSQREAMKYLMERLSTDPDQRHGAMGLAAELGCQPLPLAQATATITTSIVSCEDYQDRFTRRRARLAGSGSERPPVGEPAVVWMSRAVAAQVRAATPPELSGQAVDAAADALLQLWPDEPQPSLATGLRSCVASLQQAGGERLWAAGTCHRLLLRAGHSMDNARLTGPAASYWSELATTSEKVLGSDNPGTLTIANHLIQALLAAGRAAEAVEWSQWVLGGQLRTLGPDHLDTLAARVNHGRALVAAGRARHAVTVLAQATADYERIRGPGHLDSLGARDELAAACQAAGSLADAVAYYRQTLADRERVQGTGHPDTMTARDKLAGACLQDGRANEAISHFKQALADRQRVLGADHLDTIAARAALAAACQTAGKTTTALQLHEQVCTDYEQVLGPDHRDTLAHRANLATAYQAAGRLTDAAALLRDTLSRCQQALPPGDPLTQVQQEP